MSIMTTPPPTAGTATTPQLATPPEVREQIFAINRAEPQPPVKKRLKVEPAEGSRLSALLCQLPELEAAAKDAAERLKETKKSIQAEIAATIEDPEDLPDVFDIPSDAHGGYPAYTMSARQGSWRLDTESMKNQDPATYVKWAVRGEPYWELKRCQRNRVKRG